MRAAARALFITGSFLLAGLATAPAQAEAECAGLTAVDTCLIGAWRQSGGGAVEWMKRNMPPGMPVPQVDQSGQVVVLNRDGTYWTIPTTGKTTVRLEGPAGNLRAESTVTAQAKGRWSAQAGTLNLCPDEESIKGETRIMGPGGRQHAMPMAPNPVGGPMSLGYRCSESGLETKMTVPGINDPMTTQYARAKP